MNTKKKENIHDELFSRLVENVWKSGFWFQYLLFALDDQSMASQQYQLKPIKLENSLQQSPK